MIIWPGPQDPNSPRLGPWGLKGVTTQVLHHLNKNTNIYFYKHFKRQSKKGGGVGKERAQSHGSAPESSASCNHFKMRATAERTH
jgi:hypothetical protein